MEKNTFDDLLNRKKTTLVGLAALLVLSLLSNLVLLTTQNDQLVILVPGQMSTEWKVSSSEYDEHYLADASTTIAEIYMETTPDTAEWRRQKILRWVHPASTQSIAKQITDETNRIKRQKLTTAFSISEVAVRDVGEDIAHARVTGDLTRFVTGKPFAQDKIVVSITWSRDSRTVAKIKGITWEIIGTNEKTEDF